MKEKKYTSFMNFMVYFEAEARPELMQDAEVELERCTQTDKEDIGSYFYCFMELLLLTNRCPEDCVFLWIDGIRNGEVRKMVSWADCGGERLTLEKPWKHAAQIEANSRLAEMRRKGRGEH